MPKLQGLGGMVSFQARLAAGLQQRGIRVSFDPDDPACRAILVIGGTRRLADLWRARRRGRRIVQRLDGLNWLHRKQKSGLRYYLRAEMNNRLLAFIRRNLADSIVYQSEFSRRWWQQTFGILPTPNRVIYNGIDLDIYSPAGPHRRPEDHFRILLLEGHLGKGNSQGLASALGMLRLLQEVHHLPVHLVVIGDISADAKSALNVRTTDPVTWAGILGREQIPEADRSAHLLFSADLNAACPNVVVEALACGLPVVSFDTGALSEMVTDGSGLVVPYGSDYWRLEPPVLEPLAESAASILAENAAYRLAARRRAEAAFGLDQMVEGYLQALSG